jgi:hypothetical protein
MYFKKPLISSDKQDIFHLAPVPVYMKVFDDHELHDKVYSLGKEVLSEKQKLMGQELPNQYDTDRQKWYDHPDDYTDQWVEYDEQIPIGSRFFSPPNDFLDTDDDDVAVIKNRIDVGFRYLCNSIGSKVNKSKVTESWMQYYDPYSGRGHNQHNHCRWQREEGGINTQMFSGGYYLSDGEPVKDHPYSGVFAFHLRGQQYMIRPKKGMLIIWPYDIVHSVKPFYGKTQRAVINFNIQSVG